MFSSPSTISLDGNNLFGTPTEKNEDENTQHETQEGFVQDPSSQKQIRAFKLISSENKETLYFLIQTVLDFFRQGAAATSKNNNCQSFPIIWATGGTVLGAVRHQDVIPWDDDADFCVPKSNFTKFLINEIGDSERFFKNQNDNSNEQHQPQQQTESSSSVQLFALARDLHDNKNVRFEKADRVGLRFFRCGENYPFVDVFVMQHVQNFEVLNKKYPAVARKIMENDDEEDDADENDHQSENIGRSKSGFFVIDDSNGRAVWPAEAWREDFLISDDLKKDIKKGLQLLNFGPKIQSALPVSGDFVNYLNRTYGRDWNVVAKSNPIHHETKRILETVTVDLAKAYDLAEK